MLFMSKRESRMQDKYMETKAHDKAKMFLYTVDRVSPEPQAVRANGSSVRRRRGPGVPCALNDDPTTRRHQRVLNNLDRIRSVYREPHDSRVEK